MGSKSGVTSVMFCLGSMMRGGAERVVSQLANGFMKNGVEVSVVTTVIGKKAYDLDGRIRCFGLGCEGDNFVKRTFLRIVRLRKIIKKERPDVVISFLPEPSFRVLFANLLNRRKIIVSVRNDPNIEYNSFLKRIIAKLLYLRSNGFVFQTDDAKRWFPKSIQRKSTVIMNPLSDEFLVSPFSGIRKKEIVTVGRLAKQKNQRLLIDAFEIINKKYPEYKLKIIGTGVLECELKEYVKLKGLAEKVEFMGDVDGVKDKLYEASVFVLSSDYEGMPNALLEALAIGVPSISTDCPCGGPRMLMRGYPIKSLVKNCDKEKLADCIEMVINITPLERKKIASFAIMVQENTKRNRIIEKWGDYIDEVVNGN